MAGKGILTSNVTSFIQHDGRRVLLKRGVTMVRDGHPITKGREHLFSPVTVHFDDDSSGKQAPAAPIEQATAAPGEKRSLGLDTKAVREWAREQDDLEVPSRGPLPDEVVERYRAEHES